MTTFENPIIQRNHPLHKHLFNEGKVEMEMKVATIHHHNLHQTLRCVHL